ncbi:hypothetical protein ABBQ32_001586 [Trebouxia sp. C0010 RCD-2024]
MFDGGWGYQTHAQHPASTPRQDEAFDVFADPEFKAWIANTICTPPRPVRGSDPLASPAGEAASPGNWMFAMPSTSSATPFSPVQATYDMHSRPHQYHLHGHPHFLESMHSAMPQMQQVALDSTSRHMAAERPPFRSSASLTFPLPSSVADSSMTCQTPVHQQRHCDSSTSDLGQYVASSVSRPTAPVHALPRNTCDPRVTGMRRASNRIPKRSLDTDFELSQVSPIAKGRAGARRGPSGPCKSRKAAFTSTGAIIPQGGLTKSSKAGSASQAGSSICGLMSPFSLLKPFGDSGKGSLAELNKLIQESADKPRPTSSSDNSDAGSTGQITMSRLAKGVPVPGAASKP